MAEHVLTLFTSADQFAKEIRDVFAKRCVEDRWSEDMRLCVGATTSMVEPRNCKQKLAADQAAQLEKALKGAEAAEAKRIIPGACVRYERALGRAVACDKLPQEVRDGLAKRFADAKAGWAAMPDKSSLETVCTSAVAALKQAAVECPGAAQW